VQQEQAPLYYLDFKVSQVVKFQILNFITKKFFSYKPKKEVILSKGYLRRGSLLISI